MIIEKDLNKVLTRLYDKGVIQIRCGGTNVNISLEEHHSKILMNASVYEGEAYIPRSVRQCALGKAPFAGGWIHTNIEIDEEDFQILLSYLGEAKSLNSHNIKDLIEEFSWQADEWRLYLDENDKNDLMPIYIRS